VHDCGCGEGAPVLELYSRNPPRVEHEVFDLSFDEAQTVEPAHRLLHRDGVERAVGLRARPAHRGPFAAIEHAELDAAEIGDASHQAVQRIDLSHQMALAQAADRRVARHGADGRKPLGDKGCACAHACRGRRRFTAGMATADNDDIKASVHAPTPASASTSGEARPSIFAAPRFAQTKPR